MDELTANCCEGAELQSPAVNEAFARSQLDQAFKNRKRQKMHLFDEFERTTFEKFTADDDEDLELADEISIDGEDDEEELGGYTDDALTDLIGRLRRQENSVAAPAKKQKSFGVEETETTTLEYSDDEEQELGLFKLETEWTDEDITRHLKILTKAVAGKLQPAKTIPTVGSQISDHESAESHTNEGDETEIEESDEENVDYSHVDNFMKKLGVHVSTEEYTPTLTKTAILEKKQWLQNLGQHGIYDYQTGPQTTAGRKKWLADLAAEIADQVEVSSEEEEGSLSTQDAPLYTATVHDLRKETEKANELIHKMDDKNPGIESMSTPHSIGRRKRPDKTTTRQNDHLMVNVQQQTQISEAASSESLRASNEVKRENREPESATGSPSAMSEAVQKFESHLMVETVERQEMESEVEGLMLHEKELVIPEKGCVPVTLDMEICSKTAGSTQMVTAKLDPKPESSNRPSEGGSRSFDMKYPRIIIPAGYPPYPGYGPKWPWHPFSPRAPDGYREVYMQQMGPAYQQYMSYLESLSTAEEFVNTASGRDEIVLLSVPSPGELAEVHELQKETGAGTSESKARKQMMSTQRILPAATSQSPPESSTIKELERNRDGGETGSFAISRNIGNIQPGRVLHVNEGGSNHKRTTIIKGNSPETRTAVNGSQASRTTTHRYLVETSQRTQGDNSRASETRQPANDGGATHNRSPAKQQSASKVRTSIERTEGIVVTATEKRQRVNGAGATQNRSPKYDATLKMRTSTDGVKVARTSVGDAKSHQLRGPKSRAAQRSENKSPLKELDRQQVPENIHVDPNQEAVSPLKSPNLNAADLVIGTRHPKSKGRGKVVVVSHAELKKSSKTNSSPSKVNDSSGKLLGSKTNRQELAPATDQCCACVIL